MRQPLQKAVNVGAQLIWVAGSSAIDAGRRARGRIGGASPRDHAVAPVTVRAEVVDLVYELLDAHRDTADLALAPWNDDGWRAHLEYLRALQRKSRELIACSSEEDQHHPPPSGWLGE